MLQDYKPQLDTPKRQGRLSLVYIQATFSSGVATVDTDASSPRVTMAQDTGGDYDITFPKARFVHWVGGGIDQATDSQTTDIAKLVSPRSLDATGAGSGTGTGKVIFSAVDDGTQIAPADGTRVYITLLVGN